MNALLWVLQVLTALLYGASGIMKVFMFDKISADVPSFGALPREGWMALGILELACVVGLVLPSALRWRPSLTVVAAALLAIESLVFIGVHVKYREVVPIVFSALLGLIMAFIAYGRSAVRRAHHRAGLRHGRHRLVGAPAHGCPPRGQAGVRARAGRRALRDRGVDLRDVVGRHQRTGAIIRSVRDVRPGDPLLTRVADGEVKSTAGDSKQMLLFDPPA